MLQLRSAHFFRDDYLVNPKKVEMGYNILKIKGLRSK